MNSFAGRVGIIQRVLPAYRAPFFDYLATRCSNGLSLFAGHARASETISEGKGLSIAKHYPARNLHLFSGPAYICLQFGLGDWLSQWNPDTLIVEANPRYLSSRKALKWMHERKRPVIAWGLGAAGLPGNGNNLRRAFRKRFLSSFDHIIAYSQAGAESYAQLGIAPERISVAPNAVVAAPKYAQPPQRKRKQGSANVLFVGRLQPRKELDHLIRACASLPAELQPHLHVVGDGPERRALATLAHDTYPNSTFYGALFDKALAERFVQADLFVLPGTGGLAIQEAMSFGLPIIAGEGDGSQRDLVDEKNGWTLKSKTLGELTNTLEIALSDFDELREKGAASFQKVKTSYNLETMTETFIETLSKVSR